MNIIDAIKSGKPFRRRDKTNWFVCENGLVIMLCSRVHLYPSIDDLTADDWEIQEKTITISESQFDEAFKDIAPTEYLDRVKFVIKGRLGF